MTFKVGEKAYIVENHSYVTPVVILRSYGDFYTVAAGGAGINLRASRLFRKREDAEAKLPRRERMVTGGTNYSSPYSYMDYHSPYGI
jgi:hypothetical protein